MAMKRFYTPRPPDPANARGARLNCWSATTEPAERTCAACGTRNVQAATCRLSAEALDAVASFRFAMAHMPKALDVRGFEMNFHELFRLYINSNFDVMTWTEFARVFECHHPTVTKHVMSEIWLRMVPDEPTDLPLSEFTRHFRPRDFLPGASIFLLLPPGIRLLPLAEGLWGGSAL